MAGVVSVHDRARQVWLSGLTIDLTVRPPTEGPRGGRGAAGLGGGSGALPPLPGLLSCAWVEPTAAQRRAGRVGALRLELTMEPTVGARGRARAHERVHTST